MTNVIKYIFSILIVLSLFIIIINQNTIIEQNKKLPTNKDIIVLYEICKKKTGSKTSLILKSYGEEETFFKNYLLGK